MSDRIVEVLVVGQAVRQTFTINGAVTEVAINGAGTNGYVQDVNGNTFFARLDSPLILGAGVMFPYSYGLSTIPLNVSLTWAADDGVTFLGAGSLCIPAASCEISLVGAAGAPGLFLPHPGLLDPTWVGRARLRMDVSAGNVSMVNNPAALAGNLSVIPFLRVQHTLAMGS